MNDLKTLVNNIKINILLDKKFWENYLVLTELQIITYVERKCEEELGMIIDEFVVGMISALHFDTYRYDLATELFLDNKLNGILNARNVLLGREILDFDENDRFHMICNLIDEMYDGSLSIKYKNFLICDFIKSSNYFLSDDDWTEDTTLLDELVSVEDSVDSVGYSGWDEDEDTTLLDELVSVEDEDTTLLDELVSVEDEEDSVDSVGYSGWDEDEDTTLLDELVSVEDEDTTLLDELVSVEYSG